MIKEAPEVVVEHAVVKITDRCNFRCGHCGLGDPENPHDMSPDDMDLLLQRVMSPMFRGITLYGGEPRIHPQLEGILNIIGVQVHGSGRQLKIEVDNADERLKSLREERDNFIDDISKSEKKRMQETGELYPAITRVLLDSGQAHTMPVTVGVFTNGFGMRSPETVAQITDSLAENGVDQVTVSMDRPHQEFAKEHGASIDYDLLGSMMRFTLNGFRNKAGLPKGMFLSRGGNGDYVVPVGRAKGFSWEKRVAMAREGTEGEVETTVEYLKTKLESEFDDWLGVDSFTHCYCGPASLSRGFEKAEKFKPENRIKTTRIAVEADMGVNPCGFSILPPIGNLRDQSVEDIYRAAANSELYGILGKEGPQGLARKLTGRSDNELKEDFIERTPCGVCEDLAGEYSDVIGEMLKISM